MRRLILSVLLLNLVLLACSQTQLDSALLKVSKNWQMDTMGWNGYRSSVISDRDIWTLCIGLDSSDFLKIFGEPDYVCVNNSSTMFIYCFENWRGSPNTSHNYISRRSCDANQNNWSYLTVVINNLGKVNEKPSILWRG